MNFAMGKLVLLRNGSFNKDFIQPGIRFLEKTTKNQIKIAPIRLNNVHVINRFAYLIAERRKLMYKIIFERITFVNITTITYLSTIINSKITDINLKLNVKLFNNKKRKICKVDQEITSKKILKQNDNKDFKNNDLTLIKIDNNNKRKRGGSPIFINDSKRLKPIEEITPNQNQIRDELIDENDPKWSHFHGGSLTQYLKMMKREWGIRHLSNKHSNLTRIVGLKGNVSKPHFKKCTLTFTLRIKDLQNIERKLVREIYSLRKQLGKCRYSSQEYFNLQRKVRSLRQKMNEIDNRLNVMNEAEKEIKKINQVYKQDCPSYQEDVEDLVDLDFCKRFYTP
ncbi:uncharacterized protein [Onthophagus taurus]|uniref:uncharacterized protein n=1 Tax=Onthophagus taurus TaxID=166361 RepID=UPI0039BE8124